MVNGTLPNGWEWMTLDDICIIKYGKNLPTSIFTEHGYPVFGANGVIGNYDTYLYEDEQVLISCRGAYSGKINLSPPKCFITNNSLVLEFSKNINKKFVYYALQIVDKTKLVTGTAQPQVTINNAKIVNIPIAPIPEQERIVSRIEELFSDLDAGVASLVRVQTGLKRYKASVLKMAVEGKLFESRGVESGDELPDGWRWVDFIEIMKSLKNGFFYGRPATQPPGIPILRISAVRPMSVNLDEPRFIPDGDENKVKAYFLEKDDLLFTRYNGNPSLVGACGRVRELPKPTIYPDKLIRVKVDQDVVIPEYLEIYFATQTARKFVEGRIKSTAGQHGIAGGDLKSIPVTLPPLDEQRRIVAEVERRLSVVGEVESAVEVGLVRAGRLRQSVLRSAFEGRL